MFVPGLNRRKTSRKLRGLLPRAWFPWVGRVLLACCVMLLPHGTFAQGPVPISLGPSIVTLNGPWRFHLGDDPSWANPELDDSGWETVDLTAAPGAHDGDVGLTGYVRGWGARGHRGVSGYGWYRIHISIATPVEQDLAIAGPPAVDSAYQLFFNGSLLGGDGDFSGKTPTAYSIQPRFFLLARQRVFNNGKATAVIAIRAWRGSWDLADPQAGGIRIAPSIGYADSVHLRFQSQWLETFRGYIVEVLEAAVFVLLAGLAWLAGRLQRAQNRFAYLGAALLLTAAYRLNQAIFFWCQIETIHAFEVISLTLLFPLCLGTWTLGWFDFLELWELRWLRRTIVAMTGIYIVCRFLSCSFFRGVLPHVAGLILHFTITSVRLAFLVIMLFLIYQATRRLSPARWWAVLAILLVSIGQFAQELSSVGVRGIWFPFGTGVSRTQFAYAALDPVLLILLLACLLQDKQEKTINLPSP